MAWQRKIPFGYQMQNGVIQLHPQEAEAVHDIFSRYLAGNSYLTIADNLTEHGPRYHEHTRQWNKHMVKRILENAKYIGAEGYPRIVSNEDFLAVQLRKIDCARPVSRSAGIVPILNRTMCAVCGSPMRRDSRNHRKSRWQCQNPDCRQTVSISDESLTEQITQRLRVLAKDPWLLPPPPTGQVSPSIDAVRLQNELTLALNRGSENPDYIKALVLAAAAQKYEQLPDPTPAHDFELLMSRLETDPTDAGALADLLNTAVSAVRLAPDRSITLELVHDKSVAEEAQST